MCNACGDQKRALVPPELKSQAVVSHLVGSAYQIRVLCKLQVLLTSGLSLQAQLGTLVLNTFVSHLGSNGRSLLDRLTPKNNTTNCHVDSQTVEGTFLYRYFQGIYRVPDSILGMGNDVDKITLLMGRSCPSPASAGLPLVYTIKDRLWIL